MNSFILFGSTSLFGGALGLATISPLMTFNGKVEDQLFKEENSLVVGPTDTPYSFHDLCDNKYQEAKYIEFIANFSNFLSLLPSEKERKSLFIKNIDVSFPDEYKLPNQLSIRESWEQWIKDWGKREGYSSVFFRPDVNRKIIQFEKCHNKKRYQFKLSFVLDRFSNIFDSLEKIVPVTEEQKVDSKHSLIRLTLQPKGNKLKYFVKFVDAFGLCSKESLCKEIFKRRKVLGNPELQPFYQIFNDLGSVKAFKGIVPSLAFPKK